MMSRGVNMVDAAVRDKLVVISSPPHSFVTCAPVIWGVVQERAAAGAVGAVLLQPGGGRPRHVDHPQHPARRRGGLHLQGHQQGRVPGQGAVPQSVR